MTDQTLRVGIDVGGTKIRVGVLDEQGHLMAATQVPTLSSECAAANAEVALACLRRLLQQHGRSLAQVHHLGVGVPGTADTCTGVVEYCPNLPWLDEPLGSIMAELSGVPVLVAQDSRCAAWGELMFGAGRDLKNFLMVTVGTGIGAGLILGGRILSGDMNTAGELGHTILRRDGRPCPCGNRGCLERYASGNAIGELGGERFPDRFLGKPSAERVFELAGEGFEPARQLIADATADLAQAIVNAVDLLAVPVVLVSGGLSAHGELYVDPLRRRIEELAYFPWKRKARLRVIRAELGTDAPMVGAAFLDRAFSDLSR